jgi:hypothetical protein
MNYMFQMSAATALEFWERVIAKKAETLEERNAILLELVHEGRIQSVIATERTKEQIVKDVVKHYGNVLDLTKPDEDNSNDRDN